MPIGGGFNVRRSFGLQALPNPEIFKWPLNTTKIESWVLNAGGVLADVAGTYEGRRYLLAGTILSKRVDGQLERYTAAAGQAIYGVLLDTVEFADGTDGSDQPVPVITDQAFFAKNRIIDYATYTVALEAWADTRVGIVFED